MSGYRNYVPWKSSLPYKSGSGSTYSSRDDVNTSDVKTTPRFGSLASPAAYRPSYSGGTYRSVKRDTPLVSTPYVSRYGSSYSSAKDEKDTKPTETAKKIQPTQSKYLGSASNKENSLEPKISRYSTSTGNLAKYGTKSRDPSPATDRRPNIAVTRAKSRDPSPVVDRRHTPSFSTSTSNLSKYGRRSRDPSPIADIRLSAASPARSNLRARSRDPSPVDSRFKGSVGSTSSSYGSTYRLGQRSSTNYGSKYGSSSPSTSSTSRNNLSDKALSYMSVSDFRARSVSRTHDCTKKLEKLNLNEKDSDRSARRTRAESVSNVADKSGDHCENENKNKIEVEPEVFIPVTVVTRGTSPTPPGASSFVRSRRTDLAKTIEKTIQRSSRKPNCSDKEIQSDRLDDSTRYSRFSSAGRMSAIPWSPYTETKFSRSDSSKYSGSSGSGKPAKSDVETVEKKKKDESSSKSSSSSTRSNSKQDKSKSSSELKSSKSSTKQSSTSSKRKSTENLPNSSSRSLPPAVPKAESPTKSMSSSSSSRWPNKDFRKSALNVGPTDRPRKSRTPSTGTDTEEKCDQAKAIGSPAFGRGERSPSVGSEASGVSTATATSSSSASSSDEQKRCNRVNGKTSPVVQLQSQPDPEDDESPSVAVPIENTGSYNKITSSGFGMRGDHQKQQQQQPNQPMLNFRQVQSPEYDSPVESSSAQLVAKNEEAKSFLIRKLGSVSNFFVNRTQDTSGETIYLDNSSGNSISDGLKEDTTTASVSQLLNPTVAITSNTKTDSDLDESSWWQNTSQQINTESALDVRDDMKYKLRHIDSGEVAWWMQNENEDDTIADDLKTLNQQDDPDRSENTDRSCTNEKRSESREKSWWPTSNSGSATAEKPNRIRRIESGERAWWMNDNNSPDSPKEASDVTQNQRLSAVNEHSTSEFHQDDPKPNQASDQYNVPWWMADNSNQEPEKEVTPFKVRQSQSGEKDWWQNNSSNESPSRDSIAQREYRYSIPTSNKIRHVDSGEKAWWLQDESVESGGQVNDATETLAPEDEEIKRATSNYYYSNNNNHQEPLSQSDTRIPPLGDRASPEGLEDNSADRKSPHHNTNRNNTNRNIPTKRNRSDKAYQLFISRHTNIDELLGGSCRPLSPLMNRFAGKDGFFEEISPNQVRIHDSTAQMPVIQRMERDEWDFASTNQPYQQQSQHEVSVLKYFDLIILCKN